MKLAALLETLATTQIIGDTDVEVRAICDDSRRVERGDVFVAVRGRQVDGHRYLGQAIARGAVAVVAERPLSADELPADATVTQVVVSHAARALGELAASAAERPATRLGLIGLTGTNGKTTCSYLIEAVLRAAGHSPGVMGTVSYRYAGASRPAPYTTPTPLILHQTLADMAAAACTHAVLEVSSAALDMDRMAGLEVQVAGFTNLTQDHLDLHGDMAAYGAAKARLFRDHLAADGVAVINVDDPAAAQMIAAAGERRVLRVSTQHPSDAHDADAAPGSDQPRRTRSHDQPDIADIADIYVLRARSDMRGIEATLMTPRGPIDICAPVLIGDYNLANLALTVAIGEALGIAHEAVARGMAEMPVVPGRLERVANQADLDIVVDYAHTPDALDNVLRALRPLTDKRLICVFGCGGDRDPDKRPKMGAVVAEHADLAVVTSDNPRTEDPEAILAQILPAVPEAFFVHPDRARAIAAAVCEATPGDIVLIAGKGHETYQIHGTERTHFDDREQAARAAKLRWRYPLDEVIAITGASVIGPGSAAPQPNEAAFTRVILDGRSAAPGDLYVAIRGQRLDGHDFCLQAARAGAAGIIIAREQDRLALDPWPQALADTFVLAVDDPREAFGALARWHRQRWDRHPAWSDAVTPGRKPVVGVTGSAGKTTTKALIAAALSARYCVHAPPGSLNNETGVPLTLFGLMPYHDAGVVEMGMRGLGQIDALAALAEPTVGAVINAGTAHIGVVGSAAAIAQGKGEIFARLSDSGTAVYPADDERLAGYARAAHKRISFGVSEKNTRDPHSAAPPSPQPDVEVVSYAATVSADGAPAAALELRCRADAPTDGAGATPIDSAGAAPSDAPSNAVPATLALVGRHNAHNAACAVACAIAADVPAAAAASALARARAPALRGQIVDIAQRQVLIDCYNANPASMRAALDTIAELAASRGGRALAVLGDMLELGAEAEAAHRDIAAAAAERNLDVIALGQYAPLLAGLGAAPAPATAPAAAASSAQQAASAPTRGLVCHTPEEAARALWVRSRPGDWILIKASRGLRLERVITALRQQVHAHAASVAPGPTPKEA